MNPIDSTPIPATYTSGPAANLFLLRSGGGSLAIKNANALGMTAEAIGPDATANGFNVGGGGHWELSFQNPLGVKVIARIEPAFTQTSSVSAGNKTSMATTNVNEGASILDQRRQVADGASDDDNDDGQVPTIPKMVPRQKKSYNRTGKMSTPPPSFKMIGIKAPSITVDGKTTVNTRARGNQTAIGIETSSMTLHGPLEAQARATGSAGGFLASATAIKGAQSGLNFTLWGPLKKGLAVASGQGAEAQLFSLSGKNDLRFCGCNPRCGSSMSVAPGESDSNSSPPRCTTCRQTHVPPQHGPIIKLTRFFQYIISIFRKRFSFL